MTRSADTNTAEAVELDDGPILSLDGLPELIGFHLRLAHVAVYRDFSEALADLDLTQKQCATLQLIGANPGASQVDLAATLGTDRATMMAIIDRLQARGFVLRKRSIEDRRRQELHLTPDGERILVQAKDAIAEHEERFKSRFNARELATLVDALRRIHQQF